MLPPTVAHAGGATNSNPFQWLQVTNGVCRRLCCCRCWLCLISQKWIQFVVFAQLANNCVGSCRVKCSSVTTIVTLNTGQHTARGIVRAGGGEHRGCYLYVCSPVTLTNCVWSQLLFQSVGFSCSCGRSASLCHMLHEMICRSDRR